jgi:hypothetical protein
MKLVEIFLHLSDFLLNRLHGLRQLVKRSVCDSDLNTCKVTTGATAGCP